MRAFPTELLIESRKLVNASKFEQEPCDRMEKSHDQEPLCISMPLKRIEHGAEHRLDGVVKKT